MNLFEVQIVSIFVSEKSCTTVFDEEMSSDNFLGSHLKLKVTYYKGQNPDVDCIFL